MNWNEHELKLAIHIFKIGEKDKYKKYIPLFKSIQNRKESNAENTLKMKLMNIDAYQRDNFPNSGGLFRNDSFINLFNIWNIDDIDLLNNIISGEKYSIIKPGTNSILDQNKINYDIKDWPKKISNVEYGTIKLSNYIEGIRNGEYKVPLFQRKFDWTKKDIIDFLNSLISGMPFGNIVVWNAPSDSLDDRNKYIKSFIEHDKTSSEGVRWIIDGQQRTTSMISVIQNEPQTLKAKGIIFNFEIFKFENRSADHKNFILANDFLNLDMSIIDLKEKYEIEDINIASNIFKQRKELFSSSIGTTIISDSDINTVIDIFTLINTKGKRLNLFDIVHAKWLNDEISVDLESLFEKWNYNNKSNIDKVVILKSIYLILDNEQSISGKEIMSKKITEEIVLEENQNQWEKIFENVLDFIRNTLKFKLELLPSSNIFRILFYTLSKININTAGNDLIHNIKNYIRLVCINNFYSSSTDQRIKRNISDIDKMINEGTSYEEFEFSKKSIIKDDVTSTEYADGSSKYYWMLNVLFGYAKTLSNNAEIPVSSSNKKNSAINIHHIIPRATMFENKLTKDLPLSNSIANLTPILEKDNLVIGKKYPSIYYNEFKLKNSKLDQTMKDVVINHEYLKEINKDTLIDTIISFWDERADKLVQLFNSN